MLTPLILDDGSAVAVDRGWWCRSRTTARFIAPTRPHRTVPVRVTGVLLPPEAESAPPSPAAAPTTTFAKVDLGALAAQVPYRLAPAYLLLGSQQPAAAALPLVAPLPDAADAPPHLSYAIQWFSFATIAVVGFVVLVRREHRRSLAG